MKNHRLLILSLIIFNIFIVNAQDVFIYDKSGNKIYLYEQKNMYIIRIDEQYLSQIQTIDKKIEFVGGNFIKIELKNYNEKQTLLDKLKLPQNLSNIIFSKVFMATDSVIQWCTNQIVVQIMTGYDITLLLKEYNIPYSKITQFNSNKQTFLVDLYGIDDIAIKYANILYKSNKVVYAQPSFWRIIQPYSSFYRDQWGLNNTGQLGGIPGIDINAPEAWGLATGNGVKIAVVDEGIDLSHPDLFANLLTGYDATDGQYGGINGGCKGNDAHGTACAGIVAAINNDIGITGIAYNSNIIPIRIAYGNNYGGWITYDTWIADGLNKAQEEFKADVISNSWGGGSNSEIINSAIQNAVTNGRNGKGCIVVFASGNYNGSIIYPANSNPDILTVGAISLCGERKSPLSCDGEMWGSNYGKQLDIVAPGVLIPTTDIQGSFGYNPNNHIHVNLGGNKVNSDYTNRDYTIWFNGTSSACPHVAGVAALILSVNPNLTGQEVRDIIEKTAQKVRPDLYNYQSDQSHPNGTWNNEMGYGLVDAYAAVKMAKIPDTPADLLIRDYVGDDGEEPSYDPNDWLYKLLQHNPDIKLLDIDTQQPIHSIGMYKKKNCYIAVNIKNIGGKTTEGNGKERLHLFSQSYLITTLPKYVLPYYERLTPTKGLPIGKLAYNEQKVAAGMFNWELPEKKLKATAERLKEAFPSVNNPIWGFDILAIADENGSSIIKSTADTVFIAHGAEDIARRYNSAAMGHWQRRTLWDDIFNQIIRILPTANKPFSLSLSQPVDIKRGRIKDFAEVNILLSNSLMAKLITAGNPNIKVIDQNRVRLLSADAKLEFRPMSNDRDDYFAGVEVKFFSDLLPQINSFDFGLSYSEQGKEPEMVHFTAIRNSSVYFKAQAEASKTQVAGNETVTLTATNIGDEATYTWYNRSGNVIGTGTSITTVPTATDTYTLEVEREDNGYKSYCEVEVVALAGKIVSLSPNPAHSTLTVKYKLPDNAVIASIQITNIQNNISKTYAISTTATEKTISLEGLSVGSYIVKLIADGKTLHSQNLLIK